MALYFQNTLIFVCTHPKCVKSVRKEPMKWVQFLWQVNIRNLSCSLHGKLEILIVLLVGNRAHSLFYAGSHVNFKLVKGNPKLYCNSTFTFWHLIFNAVFFIFLCMCACVYTYVCTCICVHVCAYMFMNVCLSVCEHVHVCICVCMQGGLQCACMFAYVCAQMCVCACMCFHNVGMCTCVCGHWVVRRGHGSPRAEGTGESPCVGAGSQAQEPWSSSRHS